MKTILTPIDFSKVTEAVVKEAATLARALNGRVLLLTVVQPPVLVTEYAGMIDLNELMAAGEKNAARQLETIERKLKSDFVQTATLHDTGSPIAKILEHADEVDAAYIVMGSHGHTALYDLLVGSTTHGVLMRAKCPVVIVPASKKAVAKPRQKERQAVTV